MLSWLSFYVDRRSAPARVSLGITTVLTMTTLLIGIGQGSLPVVAYIKALDWYLFVSYFMVFAAFAEYAVINYRDGAYQRSKEEKRPDQNGSISCHKVLLKILQKPHVPNAVLAQVSFPSIFLIISLGS